MTVRIAVIGDHQGHRSHRELDAVLPMLGEDVRAEWVATDSDAVHDLGRYDGLWLVPGTPYRDDEAAIAAVRFAREHDVPFLGVCAGLQYAVIEYLRDVLGLSDASHAENDDDGTPVIRALACSLQGESRLVTPVPGTRFDRVVEGRAAPGMHFCSFGPGDDEVERLVADGWVVGATAPDAPVEVLELPTHPFFVLTLFQPHIGALAGEPLHPLLAEFVACAASYAEESSRHAV